MKKLINSIIDRFKEYFTEEDPNAIYIKIPKTFKSKKDQNFMIRQTKTFIIEQTEIK